MIKKKINKFNIGDRVKFISGADRFEGLGTIVALRSVDSEDCYSIKRDDGHIGGGVIVDGDNTWAVLKTDRLKLVSIFVTPTPPFYVGCKTRKIWDEVERKMFEMGYGWANKDEHFNRWSAEKENSCISVNETGIMTYGSKDFLDDEGSHGIYISCTDFLKKEGNETETYKMPDMKKIDKVFIDMKTIEKSISSLVKI